LIRERVPFKYIGPRGDKHRLRPAFCTANRRFGAEGLDKSSREKGGERRTRVGIRFDGVHLAP